MSNPKRQLLLVGSVGVIALGLYFYQQYTATERPEVSGETEAGELAVPEDQTADIEEDEATESETPEVDWEARLARQEIFTIETERYVARLSNLSTGLVALELKDDRYHFADGQAMSLVTTDHETYHPQRLEIRGVTVPADAIWEGEQVSPTVVHFRWRGDGVSVVRRVEAGRTPYQLWSTVRVTNHGSETRTLSVALHTAHYVSKDAEGGGFIGAPSTSMSFALCRYGSEDVTLERQPGDKLVGNAMGFGPDVSWTGTTDAYFSNILAADEPVGARCVLRASLRGGTYDDPHGTLFETELRFPRVDLPPGETTHARAVGYLGPNDRETLRGAGHHLIEVIDLGWFSFIADGLTELLGAIAGVVGNWGLAIILLTLLVKLVFYPLTMKSFRSMAAMRKLKPEIDKINEKYASDREKKGAAMMELYRKEKINPASGCLPSMLQMPVWFALYRSLSTNIELYHAPFVLWWTDLSAPDPYFVLPGLVAVLMHVQQRLTPTAMDPAQAKMMMYVMPAVIGVFMLFLPAGLCLYMVTNSSLTMLQQKAIYAKLDREGPTPSPAAGDEGDDDDDSDETDELQSAGGLAGSRTARRLERKTTKKRQRRG